MMRNKGLLLDRDGVINVDHGYVHRKEDFQFMPGVLSFLRRAVDCGYRLAIVTNQSGVARGLYTQEQHEALTSWFLGELRREGVEIGLALACFSHKDGIVPAFRAESFWRKPNPGMVLEAALRMNLDLGRSVLVGDSKRDLEAALAAKVGRGFWLTEEGEDLGPSVQRFTAFTEILDSLPCFA